MCLSEVLYWMDLKKYGGKEEPLNIGKDPDRGVDAKHFISLNFWALIDV